MEFNHLGNTSIISYLRDVDTTFRNDFDTDEMKRLFLENVFEEIAGHELNLIVKKSTSYILENFVSSASAEHLLQLLKVGSVFFDYIQQHCFSLLNLCSGTFFSMNSGDLRSI